MNYENAIAALKAVSEAYSAEFGKTDAAMYIEDAIICTEEALQSQKERESEDVKSFNPQEQWGTLNKATAGVR